MYKKSVARVIESKWVHSGTPVLVCLANIRIKGNRQKKKKSGGTSVWPDLESNGRSYGIMQLSLASKLWAGAVQLLSGRQYSCFILVQVGGPGFLFVRTVIYVGAASGMKIFLRKGAIW
ncbi:hypothetical protein DFH08DRAFT_811428 [Mycena albidolilacea]|uniref:Uncharacterized protein n=1 Tax=Mycena albidolilacea TaxID=1033008 RepID=A0AAD7EMW6_9AGAR|nr:hypothetical protein DFH08DRAFT_811428 [Mycena albidolilacea]